MLTGVEEDETVKLPLEAEEPFETLVPQEAIESEETMLIASIRLLRFLDINVPFPGQVDSTQAVTKRNHFHNLDGKANSWPSLANLSLRF